ncbi:MAG: LysE/ArgO family amino acid transporter [Syntrophomonadaceae bacterium]|jgi:L-lysine exporter family protein LysE/ArgO
MFDYFGQGLLLGLAYVAPIGIQNLYVINTALREKRSRALQVALITIFFDISLALACFLGVGALVDNFPLLKGIILLLGSIVVIYIGLTLIRSHPQMPSDITEESTTLLKVTWNCFAITWFNPQAIIDGSLLLGGFHASLPDSMTNCFILGVCLASLAWFLSLAVLTSLFRSKFSNKIIQWINIVCGTIILFYGAKLGYSFIQLIK